MTLKPTPTLTRAPGVITDRFVSTADDWKGKYKAAERALKKHIPGLDAVSILEGTRGRPVDSISVLINSDTNHSPKKKLTHRIEGVLKTLFNLVIDYRVIRIS